MPQWFLGSGLRLQSMHSTCPAGNPDMNSAVRDTRGRRRAWFWHWEAEDEGMTGTFSAECMMRIRHQHNKEHDAWWGGETNWGLKQSWHAETRCSLTILQRHYQLCDSVVTVKTQNFSCFSTRGSQTVKHTVVVCSGPAGSQLTSQQGAKDHITEKY